LHLNRRYSMFSRSSCRFVLIVVLVVDRLATTLTRRAMLHFLDGIA
jgi:hypothetical protein